MRRHKSWGNPTIHPTCQWSVINQLHVCRWTNHKQLPVRCWLEDFTVHSAANYLNQVWAGFSDIILKIWGWSVSLASAQCCSANMSDQFYLSRWCFYSIWYLDCLMFWSLCNLVLKVLFEQSFVWSVLSAGVRCHSERWGYQGVQRHEGEEVFDPRWGEEEEEGGSVLSERGQEEDHRGGGEADPGGRHRRDGGWPLRLLRQPPPPQRLQIRSVRRHLRDQGVQEGGPRLHLLVRYWSRTSLRSGTRPVVDQGPEVDQGLKQWLIWLVKTVLMFWLLFRPQGSRGRSTEEQDDLRQL